MGLGGGEGGKLEPKSRKLVGRGRRGEGFGAVSRGLGGGNGSGGFSDNGPFIRVLNMNPFFVLSKRRHVSLSLRVLPIMEGR